MSKHPAYLYDPAEYAQWEEDWAQFQCGERARDMIRKPEPVAVLPTWCDAAIVDSILPGRYAIVERMYDDRRCTHGGSHSFLRSLGLDADAEYDRVVREQEARFTSAHQREREAWLAGQRYIAERQKAWSRQP